MATFGLTKKVGVFPFENGVKKFAFELRNISYFDLLIRVGKCNSILPSYLIFDF